jgi:hypothetical protein
MKKLLSLLFLTGLFITLKAQKLDAKDVPAPVTDAFNTTHTGAKDVEWKKDGKYYTVEFETNKLNNAVTYEIGGNVFMTTDGIPVLNLPKCVADYVRLKNPHDKIKKASKLTDANNVVSYKAKVDGQDLHFDNTCNLIGTEKAND